MKKLGDNHCIVATAHVTVQYFFSYFTRALLIFHQKYLNPDQLWAHCLYLCPPAEYTEPARVISMAMSAPGPSCSSNTEFDYGIPLAFLSCCRVPGRWVSSRSTSPAAGNWDQQDTRDRHNKLKYKLVMGKW